jgi:hypothetical protein
MYRDRLDCFLDAAAQDPRGKIEAGKVEEGALQ